MDRDQFKDRARATKDRIREISGKLFRDKLLEKKEWTQEMGSRIQACYCDFVDDIQGYTDLEIDMRGYGDFRDDIQKCG